MTVWSGDRRRSAGRRGRVAGRTRHRRAEVAKLADARDLKSRDPCGSCGFDSRPRHFLSTGPSARSTSSSARPVAARRMSKAAPAGGGHAGRSGTAAPGIRVADSDPRPTDFFRIRFALSGDYSGPAFGSARRPEAAPRSPQGKLGGARRVSGSGETHERSAHGDLRPAVGRRAAPGAVFRPCGCRRRAGAAGPAAARSAAPSAAVFGGARGRGRGAGRSS